MTIIATDGKTMAGDGRVTCAKSVLVTDTFAKVRRLSDGRVFGASGDVASMVNAFDWIEAGAPTGEGKRPELEKDSFEAMLLDRNGRVTWFDYQCVMVDYDPPYALGVGADIAVAFMRRGLSPVEAVEVTIENHVTCGGRIVELKPTRKRTR